MRKQRMKASAPQKSSNNHSNQPAQQPRQPAPREQYYALPPSPLLVATSNVHGFRLVNRRLSNSSDHATLTHVVTMILPLGAYMVVLVNRWSSIACRRTCRKSSAIIVISSDTTLATVRTKQDPAMGNVNANLLLGMLVKSTSLPLLNLWTPFPLEI